MTYSIDSSSHFDIDPETGEITLKGYLSVNDGVTFDFDVVATDGEHQTRARVRVTGNWSSVGARVDLCGAGWCWCTGDSGCCGHHSVLLLHQGSTSQDR